MRRDAIEESAGLDVLPLRRTPTQQRSRQKVVDALAAAERILRSEGAAAITLPRVAADAGLSVGSLYQYLPDRDVIFGALVARYHARVEALIDDAVAAALADAPQADPVGYVIGAVAQIYREEEPARSLRTVASTPHIEQARAGHKARMSARVSNLVRATGARTPRSDVEIVARVAFTAADAIMHDAFATTGAEREALLRELAELLRAYLRLE